MAERRSRPTLTRSPSTEVKGRQGTGSGRAGDKEASALFVPSRHTRQHSRRRAEGPSAAAAAAPGGLRGRAQVDDRQRSGALSGQGRGRKPDCLTVGGPTPREEIGPVPRAAL
jgi:hypothetical protein